MAHGFDAPNACDTTRDVGADGERTDRYLALAGPLLQRLRHQRDRRGQEQHRPARTGVLLGDAQRGERLARAARHDQLASIGRLETGPNGADGLDLMRT